jgi:4,5-dihydroxyphthalate decarboxylase
MTMQADSARLRAVLGTYANTEPLKRGAVKASVPLDLVEVTPVYRAFKPLVREGSYEVSELALVTFLQAKAHGKPLVLLPAVMVGRFQHHCMVYNAARGDLQPRDLVGRRIGVRSWTQTTGVWLKGMLHNDYGVDTDRANWVTFEDAHVAEVSDPPGITREAAGKDMKAMLLAGELDAAIFGTAMPDEPQLKSVIRDPQAAARAWYGKHHVVPINHMVVVSAALAKSRPDAVRAVYDALLAARRAAPVSAPGEPDPLPFGVAACRPALAMMIDYAVQQQLIPRRMTVDELFEGLPAGIGA